MLTPICPTSVNRRPNRPGSSGTRTKTPAYLRGAPPCLPGIRATPSLPRRMAEETPARTPGAKGSSSAPSRAAIRASRFLATPRSEAATAGAFPAMIAAHRRESEWAMRVTSRRPWPASSRAWAGADRSSPATSEAISCGMCETTAAAVSWAAASMTTGREPTAKASRWTALTASSPRGGRPPPSDFP